MKTFDKILADFATAWKTLNIKLLLKHLDNNIYV